MRKEKRVKRETRLNVLVPALTSVTVFCCSVYRQNLASKDSQFVSCWQMTNNKHSF
jgi:hypothetical protein